MSDISRSIIELIGEVIDDFMAENERLRTELAEHTLAVQKRDAVIERLCGLIGIESPDLDLDWNRLRSGDNRALDPEHQDVFDLVAEQRAEIERLRDDRDSWADQAERNALARRQGLPEEL
jgi:hypothetical protein